MPLEVIGNSSSDGEIGMNSAVLTPSRILHDLVRTRKVATVAASTIRNIYSYLIVITCRCTAIVISGRFIYSSMIVRQTEGVFVIE